MIMTINDLVNRPELRTHYLCGKNNGANLVNWAHVSELPNPTAWLGEGDLLMTTGLGIPQSKTSQQKYIQDLIDANLAGLMIGENMNAPADISELCRVAEQYNFPILMTHYGVPFAAVTKTIVDANHKKEFERTNLITKLYENARIGILDLASKDFIVLLNRIIQGEIYILDPQSLENWLPRLTPIPEDLKLGVLALNQKPFHASTLIKKQKIDKDHVIQTIELSLQKCLLVVKSPDIDFSVIHHLAAIVSLDLEKNKLEFQRQLRLGGDFLGDMLNKRISNVNIEKRLLELQLDLTSLSAVMVNYVEGHDYETFFFRKNIPALIKYQGDFLFILLERDYVEQLTAIFPEIGVSKLIGDLDRVQHAFNESKFALQSIRPNQAINFYERMNQFSSLLPFSMDEAERIYKETLGKLIEHDQHHQSEYIHTLKVFLEHNRSWEETSKVLHIHKQTLVYRVQKIHKITGRSLTKTDDITTLWLALKALDLTKDNF